VSGERDACGTVEGQPTTDSEAFVLLITIAMLVILALAGLVLVYAAFPHRGETVPGAPWLGEVMERAADAAPVVESDEEQPWSPRG
jgi:hypothetical protein